MGYTFSMLLTIIAGFSAGVALYSLTQTPPILASQTGRVIDGVVVSLDNTRHVLRIQTPLPYQRVFDIVYTTKTHWSRYTLTKNAAQIEQIKSETITPAAVAANTSVTVLMSTDSSDQLNATSVSVVE